MNPDIIPAFPEPLLAAMPQLSEKPRLGFTTRNQAWNPGFNVCNSTAAMGLQFACSKTVSDPVESPSSVSAATNCRDNGQFSFNMPFTHKPVAISLSATVGPFNYSSTNDLASLAPVSSPWKLRSWLQFGGSVDATYNAPSNPSPVLLAGSGRNLALGRFVTGKGFQGWQLSLGPSIGSPTNFQVPLGNACGW